MSKASYIFISEIGQNRKQVLSGLQQPNIGYKEGYKEINYESFSIIKPNSFPSNSEELQQHITKLADQKPKFNMIFITIRYERLDMMNFRLKTLIKYFQPYIDNICLIITDYHKSLKKQSDYDTINRKLANIFGIKFLFAYYQQDNQTIFQGMVKETNSTNEFFQQFLSNRQVQLDGNKMGIYPQIDYKLLEKMQSRFKSMDPRQMRIDQKQQYQINRIQEFSFIPNSKVINIKNQQNFHVENVKQQKREFKPTMLTEYKPEFSIQEQDQKQQEKPFQELQQNAVQKHEQNGQNFRQIQGHGNSNQNALTKSNQTYYRQRNNVRK